MQYPYFIIHRSHTAAIFADNQHGKFRTNIAVQFPGTERRTPVRWVRKWHTLCCNDVIDEAHFAEAVTSCHYVLGSLLDPVFAHAQIFSSNEGSVVFVRLQRC